MRAAALLLLLAAPAAAQDAGRDALLGVLRDAGCRLPAQEAFDQAGARGADPAALEEALRGLLGDGAVLLDDGALALAADACAPGAPAPADPRATLVAALAANGCAMTEAEADRLLPPLGLTREAAAAAIGAMERAGEARRTAQGVALTPVLCATGERAGGALSALAVAFAAQGCEGTMVEAAAALAPLGKTEVARLVADLVDRGEATRDGARLRLDPALCGRTVPASPSMDARRRAGASEWVGQRLARAPGCRLPRATLAAEGVRVGIGPDDLALALADLAGLWGRLLLDNGPGTLQTDSVALADCPP